MSDVVVALTVAYLAAAILVAALFGFVIFDDMDDDRVVTLGLFWPIGLPLLALIIVLKVLEKAWRGFKDLCKYGIK
ncbi:hypothetical protein PP756_gp34 [Pseudomonas phage VB_PaeP_VL1]|uniref:Uncharacterized protein n=1 Tax=Pseudomonas phage VB_PaeP_VL1 TaxID=2894395 RepID=A0AAE8Z0C8_9CAUD|nr:hypothetical protein PP756_gp34 [Pseudomonas phage VB_PaeP_VL1]UGV19830.1 hypothetical protein vBPaePVL1_34 [Pseudomonas phage VB_PaeP_VL1]